MAGPGWWSERSTPLRLVLLSIGAVGAAVGFVRGKHEKQNSQGNAEKSDQVVNSSCAHFLSLLFLCHQHSQTLSPFGPGSKGRTSDLGKAKSLGGDDEFPVYPDLYTCGALVTLDIFNFFLCHKV